MPVSGTARSCSTDVRRILQFDLHYHPYKIMVVQELQQNDFIWSFTFAGGAEG
jgi:hypothetical protein